MAPPRRARKRADAVLRAASLMVTLWAAGLAPGCPGAALLLPRRFLAPALFSAAVGGVRGARRAGTEWNGTSLPWLSLDEAAELVQRSGQVLDMGRYPDPILRRRAQAVTSFGPQLTLLADALWATARAEGAVGLAASQAGVDARVIVLDPAVVGWEAENVMVNPRITSRTDEDEMTWWRERCLVLPDDVLVTLMRDSGVTVAAQDLGGRAFSQQFSGEAARAMQHELDHLDGILILDHATDPEDLMSKDFPQLAQMEAAGHEERQALAFARVVEE